MVVHGRTIEFIQFTKGTCRREFVNQLCTRERDNFYNGHEEKKVIYSSSSMYSYFI